MLGFVSFKCIESRDSIDPTPPTPLNTVLINQRNTDLGYSILKVESTPNPQAKKLVVDPAPGRIVSVFDASKGSDDPLAAAILACKGVTNVLVHTEFISVCFDPSIKWASLKSQLALALGQVDE
ncbi:MAG: NifU N-terminal domain-containing protein [Phycisphaerales bacterium]